MTEVKEASVTEVTTQVKASRRLLRRLEILTYWLVVAPVVALLPARLAYGFACLRGDWIVRYWPEEAATISRNLRGIFGETLSPAEVEHLTREAIRAGSCEVIDIMRLRNHTRPLRKLVEFRGREHLEAAIAEGKGALLCTAHFGSYDSAWSVIHASGIPVTAIGHWWWRFPPAAPITRWFWDFAHRRRLLRYREHPNIEPWADLMSAMRAVAALRRNEVVGILSDACPQEEDQHRTVKVPFLGQEARFLPGVISLARMSGAPILMMFAFRSEDHRHQVVEISAPLPVDGDLETAFRRCVAAMDAAIRKNPALWHYWTDDGTGLADIGLTPVIEQLQ